MSRKNLYPALLAVLVSGLVGFPVPRTQPGLARQARAENAGSNVGQASNTLSLPDKTTTAFRASTSLIDSLTTAGILSTPRFLTCGFGPQAFGAAALSVPLTGQSLRQNIGLSARTQATGAATSVQLAYCYWDGTTETIGSYSAITVLTAGSVLMESAYFVSPEVTLPTNGADSIRVLIVVNVSTAGNQAAVWGRSW